MQGVTKPLGLYRVDGNLWSTTPKDAGSSAVASAGTSADAASAEPESVTCDGPTGPQEATSSESVDPRPTHAGKLVVFSGLCIPFHAGRLVASARCSALVSLHRRRLCCMPRCGDIHNTARDVPHTQRFCVLQALASYFDQYVAKRNLASGDAGPHHASDGVGPSRRSDEVAVSLPPVSEVNPPLSKRSDSSGGDSANADRPDTSCVICFEEVGDHVMMPCGHGGYCRHCAHKLYVRPPNLCPICRSRLHSVVKVSIDTPIGTYTEVL